MEYRRLGRSDIMVSAVCLGTMTWGQQNTQDEGFEQMDYALERGVNFWDTAEMYSVPPREETYGRTEEIIGAWFAERGKREQVILATKAVGPGTRFPYIRGGNGERFSRAELTEALEGSLRRLQTDYIDLYQLHWPARSTNTFGQLGYLHDPDESMESLAETLAVLDDFVKAGKVRTVGLSNETPWGTMTFMALAEAGHGPRMVSVQNPYSLLNRSFEAGMAEVAIREDCGLLAYAPVAAGVLTGKYLDGARPEGARLTLFPSNTRYTSPHAQEATARYVALAREHGLEPVAMAHAFVYSRPFLTASIVGATTTEQLATAIDAFGLTLTPDVLEGIEAIHAEHTYPCP